MPLGARRVRPRPSSDFEREARRVVRWLMAAGKKEVMRKEGECQECCVRGNRG
jgi:hypothetical protein